MLTGLQKSPMLSDTSKKLSGLPSRLRWRTRSANTRTRTNWWRKRSLQRPKRPYGLPPTFGKWINAVLRPIPQPPRPKGPPWRTLVPTSRRKRARPLSVPRRCRPRRRESGSRTRRMPTQRNPLAEVETPIGTRRSASKVLRKTWVILPVSTVTRRVTTRRTKSHKKKEEPLCIMQANVGRGGSANDLASALAFEEGIDILLIQEPWIGTDFRKKTF